MSHDYLSIYIFIYLFDEKEKKKLIFTQYSALRFTDVRLLYVSQTSLTAYMSRSWNAYIKKSSYARRQSPH